MNLEHVKENFDNEIKSLDRDATLENLKNLKVKYLGKKGDISSLMKSMGSLAADERPAFGQSINKLKEYATSTLLELQEQIEQKELEKSFEKQGIDPSLPGRNPIAGTMHPLNQVRDDIIQFFLNMGFQIESGREVETDWYNFEALNIPPEHPARDMQDTFYVDEGIVLRTQTSNVQIHTMENKKPPLKIIAPGCVYRADSDASHAPMFHQVEGLMVDKDISFANLKGLLNLWVKHIFEEKVKLRFRPSFFPFTEPSAEMDVSCSLCGGAGCRVCSGTGWLEIGGCGCVDPNVFQNVNIDPEIYSGFAFGFGIDRITMIKYGIPEIGLLTSNDNRFLKQF